MVYDTITTMDMKFSGENPHEDPPYQETKEGFGRWFREQAKVKWESYLYGGEKGISIEERDIMRGFLLEYGTAEEIKAKLDAYLDSSILAYDALREEVNLKRPDILLD